jgi:hypothetical protein
VMGESLFQVNRHRFGGGGGEWRICEHIVVLRVLAGLSRTAEAGVLDELLPIVRQRGWKGLLASPVRSSRRLCRARRDSATGAASPSF